MTISNRLNCYGICFICRRRAIGIGVGNPGNIGWLCSDCSPKIGKIAMAERFDRFEERAAKAVADQLPANNFTFPADELPAFVQWIVDEFGAQLRADLESCNSPF